MEMADFKHGDNAYHLINREKEREKERERERNIGT